MEDDFELLVQGLGKIAQTLKTLNDEYNTELSTIDKEVSDVLHIIEYRDLDAVRMAKLVRHLKVLYRRRRELKERRIIYTNIHSHGKQPMQELRNSTERKQRYLTESDAALKTLGV